MVSDRSRGQLLLTTAVILAMIILGLTVLLNASVTSDIRSPDDPATDLIETDRLAQDIERGSAGLVAHIHGERYYENTTILNESIGASFATYGDLLYESTGDRRATHLTISDVAINQTGTLVGDPDRETDLAFDDTETTLIDNNSPAPLAAMVLSIDPASLPNETNDTFQVQLHGQNETAAIALYRDDDDALYVATDTFDEGGPTFDSSNAHRCDTGSYVDVDLTRFNRTGADCHVNILEMVQPIDGAGYGLTFERPEAANGSFQFVIGSETFEAADHFVEADGADAPDEPFRGTIAWSVDLSISQLAHASERHVTTEIHVYDHPDAAAYHGVAWS